MKYIITFVCLFSCFLLSNTADTDDTIPTYRPMSQRTINFGDDVCYYEETSNELYLAYVKPCEESKKCVQIPTLWSANNIHICQERSNEEYDNKDKACETKAYLSGLDCTSGYSCDSGSKCSGDDTCPTNQVRDYLNNNRCVNDPGYCAEYEYDSNGVKTSEYKNHYESYGGKKCIQLELVRTGSTSTIYQIQKNLTNYVASIDDGNYINDDDASNMKYCKSGYALYFYGNGKLENPNTDSIDKHNEKLYLRCVTVLGRDKNGIIKYQVDGAEKYYKPTILDSNTYSLPGNDENLEQKIKFFKNYKERLDSLGCRETGDCEDYELCKWEFFYDYPDAYYLYQNEPQVLEYLLQRTGCKFKPKHTSPTGSSNLLNIKYLTLLSLLLLF